jgi:hypothetical protein
MRNLTEEEIRKRAYELWKVAERNKPDIKMDAFWYQAEKELLAERAAEESWSRTPNEAHRRAAALEAHEAWRRRGKPARSGRGTEGGPRRAAEHNRADG